MSVRGLDRRAARFAVALVAMVALASASAVVPATAGAQDPAACQQYPTSDCGDAGPANGGGDTSPGIGPGGGAGAPSAAGTDSGSSHGTLPFTGYPMTPLLLLVLALLAAGLMLRAALAVRDRLRAGRISAG
jgi:hypothetical protein